MKRISALILAASAAVAAPAFAETIVHSAPRTTAFTWDPATQTYVRVPTVVYEEVNAPPPVTYVEPARVEYAPPIVVTAPRPGSDYAINSAVADTIAADPHIRGYVETQTFRGNVTLNGRVTTPEMVDRAERDAKSVDGTRDVENLIKPRVGGGY